MFIHLPVEITLLSVEKDFSFGCKYSRIYYYYYMRTQQLSLMALMPSACRSIQAGLTSGSMQLMDFFFFSCHFCIH